MTRQFDEAEADWSVNDVVPLENSLPIGGSVMQGPSALSESVVLTWPN
ncbi:hypothetical protein [Nocardia miyunensis]|nr:hypothetical protein [Nocardia miyunensis]